MEQLALRNRYFYIAKTVDQTVTGASMITRMFLDNCIAYLFTIMNSDRKQETQNLFILQLLILPSM